MQMIIYKNNSFIVAVFVFFSISMEITKSQTTSQFVQKRSTVINNSNNDYTVYVLSGENATLVCQNNCWLSSNKTMTSWIMPNNHVISIRQPYNSSQSKYFVMTSVSSRDLCNTSLTVTNASTTDEGYYTCRSESVEDTDAYFSQILLRIIDPPPIPFGCRLVRLAIIHPTLQCNYDVTANDHVTFELFQSKGSVKTKLAVSERPVFDINKKLLNSLELDNSQSSDARQEVIFQICCVSVYTDEFRSCGQNLLIALPSDHHGRPSSESEDTSNRDIVLIGVSASVLVFIVIIVLIFIYYWRLKKKRERVITNRQRTNHRGNCSVHNPSTHDFNEQASNPQYHSKKHPQINNDTPALPTSLHQISENQRKSPIHPLNSIHPTPFHHENYSTTARHDPEPNLDYKENTTNTSTSSMSTPNKQSNSFYKRFVPSNLSLREKNKQSSISREQTFNGTISSCKNLNLKSSDKEMSYSETRFKERKNETQNCGRKILPDESERQNNDGYWQMSSFCGDVGLKENLNKKAKRKNSKPVISTENTHAYVNLIAFDAENVLCDKNVVYDNARRTHFIKHSTDSTQNQPENASLNKQFPVETNTTIPKPSWESVGNFDDISSHYKSTPELRIFDDSDIVDILNAGGSHNERLTYSDNKQLSKFIQQNTSVNLDSQGNDETAATLPEDCEDKRSVFKVSLNPKTQTQTRYSITPEIESSKSTESSFQRDMSQASIRRYFYNKRLTVISPHLDLPPKLPSKATRVESWHYMNPASDGVAPLFMTSLPNLSNIREAVYDVPKLRIDEKNYDDDDAENIEGILL